MHENAKMINENLDDSDHYNRDIIYDDSQEGRRRWQG